MTQQQGVSNYKNFLRTLSIIHFAIMSGLIIACVFLTNLTSGEGFPPLSFTQQPLEFILPLALIGAVIIGRFLENMMLNKLKTEDRLQKKLATYQTTHLIKIALLEGVAFLSVFSYANNSFFLVIAGLALVLLFTLFPTKEKIENALPISAEDQVYLKNSDKAFGS